MGTILWIDSCSVDGAIVAREAKNGGVEVLSQDRGSFEVIDALK
jgi:hypothetical protein